MNALSHGCRSQTLTALVPGCSDRAALPPTMRKELVELAGIRTELEAEHTPTGILERHALDRLSVAMLRWRRAVRFDEAALLERRMRALLRVGPQEGEEALAEVVEALESFSPATEDGASATDLAERYRAEADRALRRALDDLVRIRSLRTPAGAERTP